MASFINRLELIVDREGIKKGKLIANHSLPYSCITSLPEDELQHRAEVGEALRFRHKLTDPDSSADSGRLRHHRPLQGTTAFR